MLGSRKQLKLLASGTSLVRLVFQASTTRWRRNVRGRKHVPRVSGIYHEVARKRLKAYDKDCPLDELSFITLAYKALEPEPVQKLLDNWKSWTGAGQRAEPS